MTNKELRKKQITARRQDQILRAAMEVFTRKGYAAATVPQIAQTAGVATGTIYLYYPSKRELFIALMQRIARSGAVPKILGNMPSSGFPATFKGLLQNKLKMARNVDMSSIMLLWSDILREPELKAQLMQQLFLPFMSRMEAFYRSRMETGEFRPLDPAVVSRSVVGMVAGLVLLSILEGDRDSLARLNSDKLSDEVMDILLNGLIRKEAGKTGP